MLLEVAGPDRPEWVSDENPGLSLDDALMEALVLRGEGRLLVAVRAESRKGPQYALPLRLIRVVERGIWSLGLDRDIDDEAASEVDWGEAEAVMERAFGIPKGRMERLAATMRFPDFLSFAAKYRGAMLVDVPCPSAKGTHPHWVEVARRFDGTFLLHPDAVVAAGPGGIQ